MIAPTLSPLVIRFGRMGDMVLQAPLLHLLHRRFGQPCSLLSSGTWSAQLYAGNDDVETIRELHARHAPFALSPQRWQLVRELRKHQGPVYVSEDIPRQADKIRKLLRRARIPADRCLFLTDCKDIHSVHWVDRLLDFGRLTPTAYNASDYPWYKSDLQRAPRLPIRPIDRSDLRTWLEQRGLGGRTIVLVQPGNKRTSRWRSSRQTDSKTWPSEHWATLLVAMRERLPDAQLLLCGSMHEASLLEEIRLASGLDRMAIATRDLPLRRLLALAEIAHSMVAVDTGPAHLAAAAGCPLVILYGAESPERWDRRRPCGRPVINLGGPAHGQRVDAIGLDEVVAAWSTIVAAAESPRSAVVTRDKLKFTPPIAVGQ